MVCAVLCILMSEICNRAMSLGQVRAQNRGFEGDVLTLLGFAVTHFRYNSYKVHGQAILISQQLNLSTHETWTCGNTLQSTTATGVTSQINIMRHHHKV